MKNLGTHLSQAPQDKGSVTWVWHLLYVGAFQSQCFPFVANVFYTFPSSSGKPLHLAAPCAFSRRAHQSRLDISKGLNFTSQPSVCDLSADWEANIHQRPNYNRHLAHSSVSQSPSEGKHNIISHPMCSNSTFIPGSYLKITLDFFILGQLLELLRIVLVKPNEAFTKSIKNTFICVLPAVFSIKVISFTRKFNTESKEEKKGFRNTIFWKFMLHKALIWFSFWASQICQHPILLINTHLHHFSVWGSFAVIIRGNCGCKTACSSWAMRFRSHLGRQWYLSEAISVTIQPFECSSIFKNRSLCFLKTLQFFSLMAQFGQSLSWNAATVNGCFTFILIIFALF